MNDSSLYILIFNDILLLILFDYIPSFIFLLYYGDSYKA